MNNGIPPGIALASRIAGFFRNLKEVQAIGLGGSLSSGSGRSGSDVDLYIYTTSTIPLDVRVRLVDQAGAGRRDLNLQFWDLGDEWVDTATGIEVDVMYWDTAWIVSQLERVLVQHEAAIGYSTSHWHTLRNTQILYDPGGWLHELQTWAEQPYPEALRQAIIAKNHPLLRNVIPAYLHQIDLAVERSDLVSINHRVAALLASYFDVLFALNRVLNPGEKRLLAYALDRCEKRPARLAEQVNDVLRAAYPGDRDLVAAVTRLVDGLDEVLRVEGFDPLSSRPV